MRGSLVVAVALVALVFAGPASGAIVTVDPDAFANGTDISNAFAGITLSVAGSSDTAVFARADTLASTGERLFANGGNGIHWGGGGNTGMRVDFVTATDFVAIDIIGNDSFDIGQLLAYDSSDVLIDSHTTAALGTGDVENASVSGAGIAWILATGSANNLESVSLDFLTYNVRNSGIPEPSTVAIWSVLGVFGMVAGRRRRRRSA